MLFRSPALSEGAVGPDGRFGFALERNTTYQLVGIPPASANKTLASTGVSIDVPASGTLEQDLTLPAATKQSYTVDRLYPTDTGGTCDGLGNDGFTKLDDEPLALSDDGSRLLAVVCDKDTFTRVLRVVDLEIGRAHV